MHNHERSHCRRIAKRVDLDRTPAYDPNCPTANRNPPIVAYKKTQVGRIVNTTLSDSGTRWPNIAEANHTEYRNPDHVRRYAAGFVRAAAGPRSRKRIGTHLLDNEVVEIDNRGVWLLCSSEFLHASKSKSLAGVI